MRGRTVALTRRICFTALVSDLLHSAPPACGRASAPRAALPALLRCAGRGLAPLPLAALPAAARPAARATPQAAAARRSTQPRPSSTAAARSSTSRGARGWAARIRASKSTGCRTSLSSRSSMRRGSLSRGWRRPRWPRAPVEGEEAGGGGGSTHCGGSRGGVGRERENGREGVKVEDSTFGGYFCIYSCHMAPSQGVWT